MRGSVISERPLQANPIFYSAVRGHKQCCYFTLYTSRYTYFPDPHLSLFGFKSSILNRSSFIPLKQSKKDKQRRATLLIDKIRLELLPTFNKTKK